MPIEPFEFGPHPRRSDDAPSDPLRHAGDEHIPDELIDDLLAQPTDEADAALMAE